MSALVALVRPVRVVIWVVALGYTVWWLWQAINALVDALLGAPSNLIEVVLVWGAFLGFAVLLLDRVLAQIDPVTARARYAAQTQERNLQMLEEAMTSEQFVEKYQPWGRPDGGFLTFEQVKMLPAQQVWTIVECGDWDTRQIVALPGFQKFARLGYMVTNVPWEDKEIEAFWTEETKIPNPWLVALAKANDEDLLKILGEFGALGADRIGELLALPEQMTPEKLRSFGISVDLVEVGP